MRKYIISSLLVLLCGTAWAQKDSLAQSPADTQAVAKVQPAAQSLTGLSVPQLWDRANTAYINGDFHAAVEAYEQIASKGLGSAKLSYNLANAYFKEGRLGKAILYYRRALRLTPGDEDVRYNLSVVEARTKDNIEQIPEFFVMSWIRSIRHIMGCTGWSILSLIALAGALALFLMYLLAQRISLRKAGFYGTMVATLLFICATWFAVAERHELRASNEAVIMTSSTAVKSSPDKSATDLFVLHEGTVVRVTNQFDTWREVTIADGKKGWIEAQTIETI